MEVASKQFGVRLLRVGEADIPGPELFWMREWDRWFTLVFQSVLVQGDGVTALVSTVTGARPWAHER
jgi:hypothetical protein